jgi:hypothetical protein
MCFTQIPNPYLDVTPILIFSLIIVLITNGQITKVFVVINPAYTRQNGKFRTVLSKIGYSISTKLEFTLTDGN